MRCDEWSARNEQEAKRKIVADWRPDPAESLTASRGQSVAAPAADGEEQEEQRREEKQPRCELYGTNARDREENTALTQAARLALPIVVV